MLNQLLEIVKKENKEFHSNESSIFIYGDSRDLMRSISDDSVDCIITSPPYMDVKNYGGVNQIGYKQDYKDYMSDMNKIFLDLFRVAKEGCAFWLIVDNVKRSEGLIMLPFELAKLAESAGWKIHDLITWDKGKSLPWGHSGKLRGVSEQIILLGKGNLKTFNLDAVREISDLSHYWIKYPERYSPVGKSPSNLWHFPIPVQGSWAAKELRHACPFPEELVRRCLLLTTLEGDMVLDPFAGSGMVLSTSIKNNRKAIALDSSRQYFDSFKYEVIDKKSKENIDEEKFANLIMSLRKSKAPIELFKQLSRPDELNGFVSDNLRCIFLESKSEKEIEIFFLVEDNECIEKIQNKSDEIIKRAPLSKFGLNIKVKVLSSTKNLQESMDLYKELYEYNNGKFYKTPKTHREFDLIKFLKSHVAGKYPTVVSNVNNKVDFLVD